MRQNILITGASSGLGLELAKQFAAMGRSLALCARRVDRLEALKAELLAAHPGIKIAVRPLDVLQYDDVFRVFGAFAEDLGGLDRIIVNAGIGKGQKIGMGNFKANRRTLETNVVAALAQCEAALEIFRKQGRGHLVVMSSVSSVRGMPGHATAYAASKAALSSLAEGIRMDCLGTPIRVTTLEPGFIASEMTGAMANRPPFMVDTVTGCRALLRATEQEVQRAYLPMWPWSLVARLFRWAPLSLLAKML